MTELEKLKHLLEHWIEHNEAHVKTYDEWAARLAELPELERSDAEKIRELSDILRQIADDSRGLDALFKKAQGIV